MLPRYIDSDDVRPLCLLTTLTDFEQVPAHVVGLLYRYRWQQPETV
jgi:hypothetical protein